MSQPNEAAQLAGNIRGAAQAVNTGSVNKDAFASRLAITDTEAIVLALNNCQPALARTIVWNLPKEKFGDVYYEKDEKATKELSNHGSWHKWEYLFQDATDRQKEEIFDDSPVESQAQIKGWYVLENLSEICQSVPLPDETLLDLLQNTIEYIGHIPTNHHPRRPAITNEGFWYGLMSFFLTSYCIRMNIINRNIPEYLIFADLAFVEPQAERPYSNKQKDAKVEVGRQRSRQSDFVVMGMSTDDLCEETIYDRKVDRFYDPQAILVLEGKKEDQNLEESLWQLEDNCHKACEGLDRNIEGCFAILHEASTFRCFIYHRHSHYKNPNPPAPRSYYRSLTRGRTRRNTDFPSILPHTLLPVFPKEHMDSDTDYEGHNMFMDNMLQYSRTETGGAPAYYIRGERWFLHRFCCMAFAAQ